MTLPLDWIDHCSQHQDEANSCMLLWLMYITSRTVPTSFAWPVKNSKSRWTGRPFLSTQITPHSWPEPEQDTTWWGNSFRGWKESDMASSIWLISGLPTNRSRFSPHQKRHRFISHRTLPHRKLFTENDCKDQDNILYSHVSVCIYISATDLFSSFPFSFYVFEFIIIAIAVVANIFRE